MDQLRKVDETDVSEIMEVLRQVEEQAPVYDCDRCNDRGKIFDWNDTDPYLCPACTDKRVLLEEYGQRSQGTVAGPGLAKARASKQIAELAAQRQRSIRLIGEPGCGKTMLLKAWSNKSLAEVYPLRPIYTSEEELVAWIDRAVIEEERGDIDARPRLVRRLVRSPGLLAIDECFLPELWREGSATSERAAKRSRTLRSIWEDLCNVRTGPVAIASNVAPEEIIHDGRMLRRIREATGEEVRV